MSTIASRMPFRRLGQHLDGERAEAYALGQLLPEEVEDIDVHLLVCEECRTKLTEETVYVEAMRVALDTHHTEKNDSAPIDNANIRIQKASTPPHA